ncbi:hypothetical protein L596_023568 [Steinernema carpocapsae]|uniref:Uncharacterized protein n=1 Tax=Steinernema carpocapsae TaxID=34508 RepID=A0A4U5ME99_STECR|nr:hypothetical protein L596_023568 [Steinernema carpocapsae]
MRNWKIRELVPESDAYMDLLDYEKKLDATITRKRLEIQEALKKPMKVKRKLRIYVSHTFTASSPESDDKPDKGWELRVEGQLIDSENAKNRQLNGRGSVRKFSSFFKRLIIELDLRFTDLTPESWSGRGRLGYRRPTVSR